MLLSCVALCKIYNKIHICVYIRFEWEGKIEEESELLLVRLYLLCL